MKSLQRTQCAITGSKDLEHLYTFEQFPVFMGCSSKPENTDVKADMAWMISRNSGLIQLESPLPLDLLYQESHGSGSIGSLWVNHHKAFAQFLHQGNPSAVFEIGGGHGILANEFCKTKDVPWVILEPNPSPVPGTPAKYIKGFFDAQFTYSGQFDTVVHSHVFEHIYDPNEFMAQLSQFMEPGKKLVFSIPNMQVMLERKYTNCINFEHTIFLTEPYIEFLLAKYGFALVKKEYFMDDHSIFYSAVRDTAQQPSTLPAGLYEKNKGLYQAYIAYHKDLIHTLNAKMLSTQKPIYLFGAHVFAQYLISFGLDTSRIVSLLDNDPHKTGKRLYGTSSMVNTPKILSTVDSPVVILKAGVYNNEIKKDIVQNINAAAEFWE